MSPLVTVLVPAFNAERTLRRAIDSVFIQDYPNFELIIVDDCSTDSTADIARSYQRREINLISLPKNVGECGAMNAGLAVAKGKYIAFLDADDEWRPTKLAKQVDVLEGNPAAILVSCGGIGIDTNGREYRHFSTQPSGSSRKEFWRYLLARSAFAKPCIMARTSVLSQVGPFDTKLLVAGDQDMWIRLTMMGEVAFIDEYLAVIYDTRGSLTKVHARTAPSFVLPMIKRHLESKRSSLSPSEVRHILGERYTTLGRNLCISGSYWRGAAYLIYAASMGTRVTENLSYLVLSSRPARWAKRVLKLRPADA